ncbi:MAG: SprB repeat-containing protein [Chitinophagales bacterium]|nr:SprB repeat-containing protein [Chitinophagales bacterium]
MKPHHLFFALVPLLGTAGLSAQISIDPIIVPTTCGNCNGSININAIGGTPPYTYTWNGVSGSPTLDSVCAGSYQLLVTDVNGQTAAAELTLDDSSLPELTFSLAYPFVYTCDGTCGIFTNIVYAPPGYAQYEWAQNWDTAPGGAADNACYVYSEALYEVTVTDANGCTQSGAYTPLSVLFCNTDDNCGNCDATFSVMPNNGTPPYTYTWSTGEVWVSETKGDTLQNLCAGTYQATVSDATGYAITITALVNDSSPLYPVSFNQQFCTPEAINYTANFSQFAVCLWNDGLTDCVRTLTEEGTHSVLLTNDIGCNFSVTYVFGVGSSGFYVPLSAITGNTPIVPGGCTTLHLNGYTDCSYLWSNGSTNADNTVCAGGNYCVSITDTDGCVGHVCAQVSVINDVQPVPRADGWHIGADGRYIYLTYPTALPRAAVLLTLYATDGQTAARHTIDTAASRFDIDRQTLPTGLYVAHIVLPDGTGFSQKLWLP